MNHSVTKDHPFLAEQKILKHLVTNKHIKVDKDKCLENLEKSPSLITPLIGVIGYDKASEIVKRSLDEGKTIRNILVEEKLFTKEEIDELLEPLNITRPGIIKGVK